MNSGPLVLPLLPRLFTFLSELRLLCLLLALLELELEPRLLLVLLLRLLHRASQSVFDPSVATFASSQPSSCVSVKVDVKLLSRDYLECTTFFPADWIKGLLTGSVPSFEQSCDECRNVTDPRTHARLFGSEFSC